MYETTDRLSAGSNDSKLRKTSPSTPQAKHDPPRLRVPILSPTPIHRLSPALDEFSLRLTPSRGGTASPIPAKGVRKRLHQYRNFDHAVDLLQKCKNIVILTGAGISTSAGIPDFRSDKGLYQQLSKDLGITEAEEFFSRDYFIHNTGDFFHYVRRVIPEAVIGTDGYFKSTNPARSDKERPTSVPKFTPTHAFLALLHAKRKLLTNYTQNIDGLEIAAGVPRAKFIQCHGSWDTASCLTCGRSSAAKKYLPVVFAGNIPYCKCKLEAEKIEKKKHKKKLGKKRSWDDFDSDHSSDDGTQAPRGLLKPDITFFNERLSGSYDNRLDRDKKMIDLLIIIGTSLKVGPVQDMLYQISPRVPQIFISKERFSGALCNLPGVQVDIELLGECDIIIEELCRRAGWFNDLKSMFWEQGQLKIKGSFSKHLNSQRTQSISDEDSQKKISKSYNVDRPQKKHKSHEGRNDEKILKGAEDTGTSNSGGAYTMEGEVNKNIIDVPRIQALDSRTDIALETKTAKDLSIPQMQAKHNTVQNSSQSVSRSLSDLDLGASQVKIELMAGTAHQWRISRR